MAPRLFLPQTLGAAANKHKRFVMTQAALVVYLGRSCVHIALY